MSRYFWWVVLGCGLYGAVLLVTLAGVPFHPDESTYIYTSQDFEVWGQPARTAYQPAAADLMQHYRLVDAPLWRYTLGALRWASGLRPLPVDWYWAHTWAENAQAGALPTAALLWLGRFPAWLAAWLTPLLLLYVGRRLGGWPLGLLAALLYALNALILLHTRRAMSESLLLLSQLLTCALVLRPRTHPAWVGLSAGLAYAAKLTGLAVVGVSGLALLIWPLGLTSLQTPSLGQRARAICWWAGLFLVVTALFNPILWSNPWEVGQAMVQARQTLVTNQVTTLQRLVPQAVLVTPQLRGLAVVYHVYLAPLSFWEAGNYAQQTGPAEIAYLALGFTQLGHSSQLTLNLLVGGLGLVLTLFGMGLGVWRSVRPGLWSTRGPLVVLLCLSTVTLAGMFTFPMAWQRYYLPLVPLMCLWVAYALVALGARLVRGPRRAEPKAP